MADYEDNQQKNSFTLFNNETGKSYELPVIKGTDGPDVLDIRKLYKETGMFTYDPGFTSTASCDSSITYIDGNKGILRKKQTLMQPMQIPLPEACPDLSQLCPYHDPSAS